MGHHCQQVNGDFECEENPRRDNKLELYLGEYAVETNYCPFCGYQNPRGRVIDYTSSEDIN